MTNMDTTCVTTMGTEESSNSLAHQGGNNGDNVSKYHFRITMYGGGDQYSKPWYFMKPSWLNVGGHRVNLPDTMDFIDMPYLTPFGTVAIHLHYRGEQRAPRACQEVYDGNMR